MDKEEINAFVLPVINFSFRKYLILYGRFPLSKVLFTKKPRKLLLFCLFFCYVVCLFVFSMVD